MSKEYDDTDRGVLFRNEKKENYRHPDYTGNINVGGEEYWLSAWIKEGQKGKFMSLSVKQKEEQKKPAGKSSKSSDPFIEDDVPF